MAYRKRDHCFVGWVREPPIRIQHVDRSDRSKPTNPNWSYNESGDPENKSACGFDAAHNYMAYETRSHWKRSRE
ncbi:unnamed protein product [Arabis nemorensis]|uniref:Uncharacterized protein n=1 Tax=Arabis nemorensis TaxID=586526 RepID=A0A565AXM6_9BRAS|nr:unnamed protein product [Arabis nemorensis]